MTQHQKARPNGGMDDTKAERLHGKRVSDFERGVAKERAIDPAEIRRLFCIRYFDGKPELCWRERRSNVAAGALAGCVTASGYRRLSIAGMRFCGHRVMWAYVHGRWPTMRLDHINGNGLDNRIENLREVSHQENHRNAKLSRRNKSGFVGVYWYAGKSPWRAFIKVDGRLIALGSFADMQDAIEARKAAERAHGFHPNHGRKSNASHRRGSA